MNGKGAETARLDRDYGIVFQAPVLYDWRTVAKNLALPLELAGWNRARRQERVGEMLELVELTGAPRGRHEFSLPARRREAFPQGNRAAEQCVLIAMPARRALQQSQTPRYPAGSRFRP